MDDEPMSPVARWSRDPNASMPTNATKSERAEARSELLLPKTLEDLDELFRQSEELAAALRTGADREGWLLRNAAVGIIVRLGEAAKNLPSRYLAEHPEVRFRGLIRMRDLVAHRYEDVDWDIVWDAVLVQHPIEAAKHLGRTITIDDDRAAENDGGR